jgi:hypothetical protein
MKETLQFVVFFFAACASADSQAVPAATGPGGPVSGNLHYSFRSSGNSEFGGGLGNWNTSTSSASLDYANGSERHPFTLSYSGGYAYAITGPSFNTGVFQHLLWSQGFVRRKWNVAISDDASDRPQAPTTGFSGIAGIGEPIGGSGSTPASSQSILTLNARAVENDANGKIERALNRAIKLNLGGGSSLLRYPDGNGLDTNTEMANAGLALRLTGRNSLSGSYMLSEFSYPGFTASFTSQSALLGFSREWSRKVSTNISAGPQWTGSSDSNFLPHSTTITANAAFDYKFRLVSADLGYDRAANGGAGYLLGAEEDSIHADFSRSFRTGLTVGLEGGYLRTTGLRNNGVTNAKFGGGQVTKQLGRYVNLFANYTVMDQSSSSVLASNALSNLLHSVSFGIAYSPRETRLRH